ncbi:MAG: hypothetical protein IJ456_04110 [Bacteroides sp.]|nr:hypothetical protein [Bacteroides sp.]
MAEYERIQRIVEAQEDSVFLWGASQVAIEFKSCEEVQSKHTKGLRAFSEEFPEARLIIVSLDRSPRLLNGIEVLPATEFQRRMWQGEIF